MTIRQSAGGAALAFVIWLAAWPPHAATAAVRWCAPMTLGAAMTEPTEVVARRKALDDWVRGARARGIAQPTWRLAVNKSIVCGKVATGIECQARGAPCVIRQNPGLPRNRRQRRRPGVDA